jgi:hypothetical protein
MLMLPWFQKGLVLAFGIGYLTIALLMINLAIMFTFLRFAKPPTCSASFVQWLTYGYPSGASVVIAP